MNKLTKEQYEAKVKELTEAADKVGYDLKIYVSEEHMNRRSSLWHGGAIATLSKRNTLVDSGQNNIEERPLEINIDAIGDVCLDIDGEMFKDKSNTGRLCCELISAGYTDDDELWAAIDKEKIYIDANNWYEISGNYCGYFVDLMCVSDYDDYLEAIQDVIERVNEFEQYIKEEAEE